MAELAQHDLDEAIPALEEAMRVCTMNIPPETNCTHWSNSTVFPRETCSLFDG